MKVALFSYCFLGFIHLSYIVITTFTGITHRHSSPKFGKWAITTVTSFKIRKEYLAIRLFLTPIFPLSMIMHKLIVTRHRDVFYDEVGSVTRITPCVE
jgi:hypothetical protein